MHLPRRPYMIAEIGINHNGDIDIAKQLIDVAVNADCDAVKFQKRNPSVCVPAHQKNRIRETPWGEITYLAYKTRIEFGEKEFDIIDRYCAEKKIEWFASAWDIESQDFLSRYAFKKNKVASAMLTNIPLLEKIAKEGKVTLISTGMSTFEEVDTAVEIFKIYSCPYALLHCNSQYPTPNHLCNVRGIRTLKERYDCTVGYSGHEVGILPSILAVAMGAAIVERHITLDRAMFGTDQSASLEPRGLELLVRDCRQVHDILGTGNKTVTQKEKEIAKKLRYYVKEESYA